MTTSRRLKKFDKYLFSSAVWTCLISVVFVAAYAVVTSARRVYYLSATSMIASSYDWPWSVKDKKEVLLNLATRAKKTHLFDAEIIYIQKEIAGEKIAQYNFTPTELKAISHAIAEK